jgi:C1A family cysteine protease
LKKKITNPRYGCVKNTYDHRDIIYSPSTLIPTDLPTKIDMRTSPIAPIFDQAQYGSCVSNAVCFAAQQKLGKLTLSDGLSRFFLYYNARVLIEGSKAKDDTGLMIRSGFLSLKKYGDILEVNYPYVVKNFAKKPTLKQYNNALKISGTQFNTVNQDLIALKTALFNGKPIVFGFMVYDSFESVEVAKTGVVPLPLKTENILGGHAVTIVGYDDLTKKFIIRNSWGTTWGDKGYCYFPYEMILNPQLCSDFTILI